MSHHRLKSAKKNRILGKELHITAIVQKRPRSIYSMYHTSATNIHASLFAIIILRMTHNTECLFCRVSQHGRCQYIPVAPQQEQRDIVQGSSKKPHNVDSFPLILALQLAFILFFKHTFIPKLCVIKIQFLSNWTHVFLKVRSRNTEACFLNARKLCYVTHITTLSAHQIRIMGKWWVSIIWRETVANYCKYCRVIYLEWLRETLKTVRDSKRTEHKFYCINVITIESTKYGSIWLRIGTSDELLWTHQWSSGFHKTRGISWLGEELLASQEKLYSMELVS
jgi:hypothetical protein